MPSSKSIYKHPGGMREERAHLLSHSSDGADYSGDSGVSTNSTNLPRPIQAARSASLQLVAEMDPTNSKGYKEKESDPDSHSGFLDLDDTSD